MMIQMDTQDPEVTGFRLELYRCDCCLPNRCFGFDLQRFAEEKTEDPTSKRQGEARSKGQVAKSQDMTNAVVIIAAFVGLRIFIVDMYEQLSTYLAGCLTGITVQAFTIEQIQLLALNTFLFMGRVLLPLLLTIMLVGVITNYLQVGFLFSTEALSFDLSKLNPLAGLQRLFLSVRTLIELLKSVFKVLLIGYLAFQFIMNAIHTLPDLQFVDLRTAMSTIGRFIYDMGMQIGMVLLILGVCDYAYTLYEHKKNLKMSKQEVKEELKQQEGNPEIKSKIKQKQRQMALQRMMQAIPQADVVVTNPTHFAVALQYDAGTMNAPVVLAVGQDHLALKIKEIARHNRIVIVENKPLAQALYHSCEVGDVIPADLFQAVAEVLAYVYRLKRRSS